MFFNRNLLAVPSATFEDDQMHGLCCCYMKKNESCISYFEVVVECFSMPGISKFGKLWL